MAQVTRELGVLTRHRTRGALVVLGPLRVEHVHDLRDDVLAPVDLALEHHATVLAAQVRERRAALRAQRRDRLERAVAVGAGNLDRVLHRAIQPPIPHHVVLGVTVDAVHSALVVNVGRHHRRIVEIELAVPQRIRRARNLRPAGRTGRKLGKAAKVEADRGIAIVAARAGVGRRRARHHVRARVTRLRLRCAAVAALAEPVERIGHVARRAAFAAVVAVEPDAPLDGAPLRPQVALQTLLAREVRVVGAERLPLAALAECGHLEQLLDVPFFREMRRHGEHAELRALALGDATLVVAVRQVPRRRRVQAGAHAPHFALVTGSTSGRGDPQVHGVLEAPPREVLGHAGHALVACLALRPRRMGLRLGARSAIATMAVDAGEFRIGVHLLDASVASEAAARIRLRRRSERRPRAALQGHERHARGADAEHERRQVAQVRDRARARGLHAQA